MAKLTQEEIEAQLNAIRLDYVTSLASKHDAIVDSCAALRNVWDQDTYEALYRLLHTLAGSAETFGLAEITGNARSLLNLFRQRESDHTLGAETFCEFDAAITRLLSSMNASLQALNNSGR